MSAPTRLLFAAALVRLMPPWLQRLVGAKVMGGLGDPIDTLVTNTTAAVKARFPSAADADSLAYIERERRIRRGLGESAAGFITRILPWWDAHKGRGGPFALLAQLDAYFQPWLNVRMDIVSNLGNRHWVDAASVVTHDGITWGGDASGKWARIWVFFYLPSEAVASPIGGAFLVTDDGRFLVTDLGDYLVTDGELTASALSEDEIEMLSHVVREWTAAHIDQSQIVLLWGARRLWNYPQPVPTWTAWGGTSTWAQPPTTITVLQ